MIKNVRVIIVKTVVLHGQSHKGSTYHITRMLLDRLEGPENEVTEFQTNNLSSCTGCFTCILKDEHLCPHRDAVQPVIQAIENADVVIAESPNYCMGMSGQLKTFFDHMSYRWMAHRPHPAMRGKIGVAISTTAGVGAAKTAKSIKQQMFWWGIPKIYFISQAVAASSWADVKPKIKDSLTAKADRLADKLLRKVGRVKPGFKSRFMFQIMKMQQKGSAWNPVDRKHWQDNGWIRT